MVVVLAVLPLVLMLYVVVLGFWCCAFCLGCLRVTLVVCIIWWLFAFTVLFCCL